MVKEIIPSCFYLGRPDPDLPDERVRMQDAIQDLKGIYHTSSLETTHDLAGAMLKPMLSAIGAPGSKIEILGCVSHHPGGGVPSITPQYSSKPCNPLGSVAFVGLLLTYPYLFRITVSLSPNQLLSYKSVGSAASGSSERNRPSVEAYMASILSPRAEWVWFGFLTIEAAASHGVTGHSRLLDGLAGLIAVKAPARIIVPRVIGVRRGGF